MHINDLELSIRAHRILTQAGITTLDALVAQSEMDLLRMDGFGRVCLREVVDLLRRHNRALRTDPTTDPPKRKLPPLEGRNKAIYEERRDLGTTFRALAAKHGVTTERIRQICCGGDRRAREALLQSEVPPLGNSSGATLETQVVALQATLDESRLAFDDLTAERDLLKARQKAIHRALVAKEFDGGRPLSPPPPNVKKWEQEQRIAELEREVNSLRAFSVARARIIWLIARASGGSYSFQAIEPSDLVEPQPSPDYTIQKSSEGVMTITAMAPSRH